MNVRSSFVRVVACCSLALLASCKPTSGGIGAIRPTGLRPAYPAEANCPEAKSLYASAFTIGGDSRVDGIHNGVDIPSNLDTPVLVIVDGRVDSVEDVINLGRKVGKVVGITHYKLKDDGLMDLENPYPWGGPFQSRNAHLQNVIVSVGQKVKMGDKIGYVGRHFVGNHFHLGAFNSFYLDPLLAYAGVPDKIPANKSVPIPYIDQHGKVHPEGSPIIWPFTCTVKSG